MTVTNVDAVILAIATVIAEGAVVAAVAAATTIDGEVILTLMQIATVVATHAAALTNAAEKTEEGLRLARDPAPLATTARIDGDI